MTLPFEQVLDEPLAVTAEATAGAARRRRRRPLHTIRASRGWLGVNLAELWRFRDLMSTLAARDLKLRYRQTLLGAMWVVLQPIMAAGVFSFLFGSVAQLPSEGVSYFLFAYVGLLGWNVFAGTVNKVNASMVSNAHLITKVYFPRLALAVTTLYTTFFDLLIGCGLLLVLLLLRRADWTLTPGILSAPLWLALLTALAMGVGLIGAALSVRYRDIGQMLGVAMQFLLFLSPVAYPASRVPPRWIHLYLLNPVAALLEAFRWSILGKTSVHWNAVLWASLASVALLAAAAAVFRRLERSFVDII